MSTLADLTNLIEIYRQRMKAADERTNLFLTTGNYTGGTIATIQSETLEQVINELEAFVARGDLPKVD